MKNKRMSQSERRWMQRYRWNQQRKEERERCAEFSEPTTDERAKAYEMMLRWMEDDPLKSRMPYDELFNDAIKVIRRSKRDDRSYMKWDTGCISNFLREFSMSGGGQGA